MALRHVGVRPLHSLTLVDFKKKLWDEIDPNGKVIRQWNLRQLNSGCGKSFSGYALEIYDCIYCPYCDEYFSKEQWNEETANTVGDSSEDRRLCEEEGSSELSEDDSEI